ncbi:lef-11 [Leucania separata nucleopolyhedrovirus]|uniref:Late expression factor 11 n=1 Tax=Leucania separata nucleopolyhedrovirus TaxID=1307956 RepID=Q0IL82_NPVLS|nr:lef-11 [Leucania separata nucleopolyhedrovirus]AAR28801.1 lef-11 [Leucania separata nucleopolyhedrovirus]
MAQSVDRSKAEIGRRAAYSRYDDKTENNDDDETTENCGCLTRSDVYAYVREIINRRKFNYDFEGVWAHMNDPQFDTQRGYIRRCLRDALIIHKDLGCKRLFRHRERIDNIFNLNTTLKKEYENSIKKYGFRGGRPDGLARKQRAQQDEHGALQAAADHVRKVQDTLSRQHQPDASGRQEDEQETEEDHQQQQVYPLQHVRFENQTARLAEQLQSMEFD